MQGINNGYGQYGNIYPYQSQFGVNNAFNQQSQTLIRVNGIEGARAYQMSANSQVALFDNNDDLMYVKVTDGAGFPTIRCFRFTEVVDSPKSSANEYVSRQEFEEFKGELLNAKQFVSKPKQSKSGADSED